LEVANQGNIATIYEFQVTGSPGSTVTFEAPPLLIPPKSTVSKLATVIVDQDGQYTLTGTATAGGVQDTAVAVLTVGDVAHTLYLPTIKKE
jgi:hypothetical protein